MEARTEFAGPVLELDFPGLRIGVAEYEEGPTGCTVFHFLRGATIERDVRGGSPGTFGEFDWVDAVCFAAWIHHVPKPHFADFWSIVDRHLSPEGVVLFNFAGPDIRDGGLNQLVAFDQYRDLADVAVVVVAHVIVVNVGIDLGGNGVQRNAEQLRLGMCVRDVREAMGE